MTGRRLGRYELVAELGSGGMATVWLARMRGAGRFERLVAIKRLHPQLMRDPRVVQMFLDEAHVAAAVRHPNVCPAFDFGEAGGSYYLAMEYLEGEPFTRLFEVLHERGGERSTLERCVLAARLMADAAEGLHAAHEARGADGEPLDVVHRDVAPANLYLRSDGVVQILDFGCAMSADRICHSVAGETRGHLAYIAPESLRNGEPDRRADVWSLGVVLWELLTGARLFKRSSVHDTLFAVADAEVAPPSQLAPDVPEELDAIVLAALQRDPDLRIPSARAFADRLRDFVQDSGIRMEVADVSQWVEHLFPQCHERTRRLLEQVPEASEAAAPTPAQVIPPRVSLWCWLRELSSALRTRPVMIAMALGLTVGLAGTWALVQLAPPTRTAVTADSSSAEGPLTGVPRSVRVPDLDEEGEDAADGVAGELHQSLPPQSTMSVQVPHPEEKIAATE